MISTDIINLILEYSFTVCDKCKSNKKEFLKYQSSSLPQWSPTVCTGCQCSNPYYTDTDMECYEYTRWREAIMKKTVCYECVFKEIKKEPYNESSFNFSYIYNEILEHQIESNKLLLNVEYDPICLQVFNPKKIRRQLRKRIKRDIRERINQNYKNIKVATKKEIHQILYKI